MSKEIAAQKASLKKWLEHVAKKKAEWEKAINEAEKAPKKKQTA